MALDVSIGGAASDSYGTLSEFQAYAAKAGFSLTSTDAEQEISLRRAAQYLDRQYGFVGERRYETQAMEWPRLYGYRVNGYIVSSETIPPKIKFAQFEMAWIIEGGEDPFEPRSLGAVKRTKSKAGPVETETEYTGGSAAKTYPAITGLLDGYVISKVGSTVALVRG